MPTAPIPTTPDPLLETQVFWSRYQREIIIGLIALIFIIAAYGAYRLVAAQREASAAEMLANAKAAPDYQKVLTEYPRSGAAASAALLLASQQREQKQHAEAITTLQSFVDKHANHQFVPTARMAIAGNLEAQGKVDEAIDLYRRIAADSPKSFTAPLALLAQVPLLKQKGQIEEARRVCETVMTQYRESYASSEATRYLRTLKPAAAAAPAPAAVTPPAGQAPAEASVAPAAALAPAASAAPTP